jgi:hypothetical protein
MSTRQRTQRTLAVVLLAMLPAWVAAQGLPPDQQQTTGDQMTASLRRQQQTAPPDLPMDKIVVERRQPIPFVPFEMVDLNTGSPIPPDQLIQLPDFPEKAEQKPVTAAEYYRQLNEIERGLCELGYSLRQDWDSIVIQRSVKDEAELQRGQRRMQSAVDESKPFRVRSDAEMKAAVEAAVAPQPGPGGLPDLAVMRQPMRVPVLPKGPQLAPRPESPAIDALRRVNVPKPAVVSTSNEYPFRLGDPSVFAAGVTGRLDLSGSEEVLKLTGAAKVDVSVFSASADIARLNAFVHAPKVGDMRARVTLDVLPFGTVYDEKLNGASKGWKDDKHYALEVPFANFRVMIGPVPVKVTAGAKASVGLHYFVGLNPSSAVAEFSPVVRSNLYVSAGVDYYVAGAGFNTSLTLVNYDLSLYGELRLWLQPPSDGAKPELGIREIYQISHKLNMLSGNASVYAYVYYPKVGLPPWGKKTWSWEMFNWAGFTPVDGELADVTRWTSLGIKAP